MATNCNIGIYEAEKHINECFDARLSPAMDKVRGQLQHAQAKEAKGYQFSFAGIMRMLAGASNPAGSMVDDSMAVLQHAGSQCSKTAEDYVEMCRKEMAEDLAFQNRLLELAEEWRNAIIAKAGRERYEAVSEKLGCDLAAAYVDHRMEQLMLVKMARDSMPKSSYDYIVKKGAENCLFGLPQAMLKSPLQAEIDARSEAAYNPSLKEKAGARAAAFGADLTTTGGFASWSALCKLAGAEAVFAGVEKVLEAKASRNRRMTVDEIISEALFDGEKLGDLRNKDYAMKEREAETIQNNAEMKSESTNAIADDQVEGLRYERSGIPSPIALGKEKEYADFAANRQDHKDGIDENGHDQTQNVGDANNNQGWQSLLQMFGLNGMSDLGRNLPYVIAMLPDMLVGMFTGKTESVGIKRDFIPMASIFLGLFVKNPLLKIMMIGMGAANLLNKMGHEAIDRQHPDMQEELQRSRFKQYPDEPLNPRIKDPALKGNVLVATIDSVPCTITIPENAAQAYACGALPLNTLANAILVRSDRQQALAQENYRSVQAQATLERSQGISLK